MTDFTGGTWRSLVDGAEVFAIPDAVVSRPADNDTSIGPTDAFGLQIETAVDWPQIGARLSTNTSGVTRAYIYRVSDGTLLGDADISSLSAGDTFTVDLNSPLTTGETYNFVVDAEGSEYDRGYNNNASFPYVSSDGDLSIVNGARNQTDSDISVNILSEIGNVGFS